MNLKFSAALLITLFFATTALAQQSALEKTLPKTVKIYGVGGLAGFDDAQSGILISNSGHILTVTGSVLDEDPITCTLNDGQKFTAKLVGINPKLAIAVLKIDAQTPDYFDLSAAPVPVAVGRPVLAITNLYSVAAGNEPMSVQHGVVSAITPLEARRGAFVAGYKGDVYIIDAITNNPGAPGGVLVDYNGSFLGLIGKQLKSTTQSIYINFAMPQSALSSAVQDILDKKIQKADQNEIAKPADAWTPAKLGFQLAPDVLPLTPAYIDSVRSDSPAAKAGLTPDDFIVMVNGSVVKDIKALKTALEKIDVADPVELLILRNDEFQTIRITN